MKNSGISSSTTTAPSRAAPSRSSFSLRGRSARLDPIHNAVRGDLADIRLAEYVFAPHYAEPLVMAATRPVALRAGPESEAETLSMLESGDLFEALDFTDDAAWGTAVRAGLVGYVDRDALNVLPLADQAAE